MRVIKPALALACLSAIPILAYQRSQVTDTTFDEGRIVQAEPIPRLFSVPNAIAAPVEEVETFFNIRKDPESGIIYLKADKNTRGILNHLIGSHGIDPEAANQILKLIDTYTESFNKSAKEKKQVLVNISDLIKKSKKENNPERMNNGSNQKPEIMPIQKQAMLVPTLRDYLNTLPEIMELTSGEGISHPISVLPDAPDIMTAHGFPFLLHLRGNISVNENSAKMAQYLDVNSGRIKSDPYIELLETGGALGPGGINGVLMSVPTVIVTKDTMYLIGLDAFSDIQEEKFDPATAVPKRNPIDQLIVPHNEVIQVSNQIF